MVKRQQPFSQRLIICHRHWHYSISTSINRSHLCYKSIINYGLNIMNILVVSPQIRYIEVFDITNPPFNEQIWPVPGDFVKSRFYCILYAIIIVFGCKYYCAVKPVKPLQPERIQVHILYVLKSHHQSHSKLSVLDNDCRNPG